MVIFTMNKSKLVTKMDNDETFMNILTLSSATILGCVMAYDCFFANTL